MNVFNTLPAMALVAIGASNACAQVSVSASNLFAIGSRYQVAIDEAPGVTPGNSGINLTWSYPGLESDAMRIAEVMAPADSPFGPAIPGTRAMVSNTDEAADHFTVTPTQLLYHGRVFEDEGIPVELPLTPPMALLNLPTQQADYIQGISRMSNTAYLGLDIGLGFIVDSIRVRTRLNYQSEVQGWGQLTTPLGTFDAIKQILVLDVTDSVDVYRADQDLWIEGIQTVNSDEASWSWWTPAHDIPVLKLFDDDNDGVVDRAEWIEADLNTTSTNDREPAGQTAVYPNPATDLITVPLEAMGSATYALHDAQGRLVQGGRLCREKSAIPVAHLERGAYVLRIEQGGTVMQARVVLQ
jgi:hypothetical protein